MGYSEGLNAKRIISEFIIPLLISVLLLVLSLINKSDNSAILNSIKDLNVQLFSILAIQIGFNISSLALIASANKEILNDVFAKQKTDEKSIKAMKQLISSFAYCLIIQSTIITLGIIHYASYDDIMKLKFPIVDWVDTGITYSVRAVYLIWIALIIHSFSIFIRNVFLIYKFILLKIQK